MLLLLACACFSEGATEVDAPSTSAPDCNPGTASCACAEDGACDEGLECDAPAQLCVPMGCTPGANGCVCHDGMCFAGGACRAGLCDADATSSGGLGTSTDADGSTSTTTSTTTTAPIDGSESSGADACMPGTCSSCAGCAECRQCLAIEGCDEQTFDCYGECAALVSCTGRCASGDEACIQTCCCAYTTSWADYNALMTCIDTACLGCGEALCVGKLC